MGLTGKMRNHFGKRCGLWVRLHNHVNVGVLFQLHLFAMLVFQSILDMKLSIEMIGILNFNLCGFSELPLEPPAEISFCPSAIMLLVHNAHLHT